MRFVEKNKRLILFLFYSFVVVILMDLAFLAIVKDDVLQWGLVLILLVQVGIHLIGKYVDKTQKNV